MCDDATHKPDARQRARAPRPGLTERSVFRCACCGRVRRCLSLDVRATYGAGRAALDLMPGAKVCGICIERCSVHPSPEHAARAAALRAQLDAARAPEPETPAARRLA